MKNLYAIAILIFLLTAQPIFGNDGNLKDHHAIFNKLAKRLKADGLDKKYLERLFARDELSLMPETLALSLTVKEAKLNYSRFLQEKSVKRAADYLNEHIKILSKAEKFFGVSAPVIVAILNVETACGNYKGSVNTFNILATQALSLEPEVYKQIRAKIPEKHRAQLSEQAINAKLKKKSARSYPEIQALIKYAQANGIDPLSIHGSIEGAIGLPQFLPSNIKRHGFDGNGDGKIDLFHHHDAIASIASYLKSYKWDEKSDSESKRKVLLRYNYSNYYAKTVLKLSALISDHIGGQLLNLE
jgi:membrane-bound lytic murein transglycosylase B